MLTPSQYIKIHIGVIIKRMNVSVIYEEADTIINHCLLIAKPAKAMVITNNADVSLLLYHSVYAETFCDSTNMQPQQFN